tara:strand:+ start:2133 stop:2579 length:447 start_codon:yes stop_codon:yes gene_type:complete
MNLEQIKAIANDIIQDKEWVNDSHSASEHKGVKDGLHRLINHLEEVKEEVGYETMYGMINPLTWKGVSVYRGRPVDSDSISIEVVLKGDTDKPYDRSIIATGKYNISTNWCSLNVKDDLLTEDKYNYDVDLENDLVKAVENRDLHIKS